VPNSPGGLSGGDGTSDKQQPRKSRPEKPNTGDLN
jgi:hypothetical protein